MQIYQQIMCKFVSSLFSKSRSIWLYVVYLFDFSVHNHHSRIFDYANPFISNLRLVLTCWYLSGVSGLPARIEVGPVLKGD